MKWMVAALVFVSLVGCDVKAASEKSGNKLVSQLAVVCVRGVQYYYYRSGNLSSFAPVVNKDTLTFDRCR